MYQYWICSSYDKEIFNKQCVALERNIEGLAKVGQITESVFGTLRQEYQYGDKKLTVICDEGYDDVHIDSEFDIEPFFKK